MNPVNPTTAFYQVFVKSAKYDNRYLLVNQEVKTFDLSYSGYGLPALIDGTIKVPSPQDLHFWKPDAICGKSIAFVGSLVSYLVPKNKLLTSRNMTYQISSRKGKTVRITY